VSHIPIRTAGERAGVDEDDFALKGILYVSQPMTLEFLSPRKSFGLIDTTAKALDRK
jgi:hypothetical protein